MTRNARPLRLMAVLGLSLFLAGSGNTATGNMMVDVLSGNRAEGNLNKSELFQYMRTLQGLVAEDPAMLARLRGEDIHLILAAPDIERKDMPSVVWQYRSASCVLDVYFQIRGSVMEPAAARSAHYEIRPRGAGGQAVSAWACLQSLYQERQEVIEASLRQVIASRDEETASGRV